MLLLCNVKDISCRISSNKFSNVLNTRNETRGSHLAVTLLVIHSQI